MKLPDDIRDLEEIFGDGFNVDKKVITRLPIHLVVGSAENEIPGGEGFFRWLNGKRRELEEARSALKDGASLKFAPARIGRIDELKAL